MNEPDKGVNINVRPGLVCVAVKADLVEHELMMAPQEAVSMGVALIQLASQAAGLAQQVQAQQVAGKIIGGNQH